MRGPFLVFALLWPLAALAQPGTVEPLGSDALAAQIECDFETSAASHHLQGHLVPSQVQPQ